MLCCVEQWLGSASDGRKCDPEKKKERQRCAPVLPQFLAELSAIPEEPRLWKAQQRHTLFSAAIRESD